MAQYTKQLLLKLTPELAEMIDISFSDFLKKTGKYITKAEFVRRIIQKHCAKRERSES